MSEFSTENAGEKQPLWRMCVVAFVFVGTTIGYIIGLNYNAVALFGACVVIFTGCINMKKAVDAVNWNTILVVAGTIGFAKEIEYSGAGEIIAEAMIKFFGGLAQSQFGMCAVLMHTHWSCHRKICSYCAANDKQCRVCPEIFRHCKSDRHTYSNRGII